MTLRRLGCMVGFFSMLIALSIFSYTFVEITQIFREQRPAFLPAAQRTRLDTLALQQQSTPTPIPQETLSQLSAEDQVLINLYQRVNPSVVSIEITLRSSLREGISANGSGFIYTDQGHIITNTHVIQDAAEIQVTFYDGYVTTAEVIGMDEYSDLAVLRVDVSDERLVPVAVGNSNTLQVGQRVVAIGNPFGLQSSMTLGIISAMGRALPSARLLGLNNQSYRNPSIIQVDAAVNPGNSGGPLLNLAGEVIGVNSAIRTESGTFEGVAFAVPSNTLQRVAPQLIERGRASYSWLGLSTFPEETRFSVASLAETLNLSVDYGVLIEYVTADSPAEIAGLQGGDQTQRIRGIDIQTGGDIIIAVDGLRVRNLDQILAYLVENTSPGDTVTLTVVRGDETLDVPVKLGVRP